MAESQEDFAFVFRMFLRRQRTRSRARGYRLASEAFGRALAEWLDLDRELDLDPADPEDSASLLWARVVSAARRLEAAVAILEERQPSRVTKADADWFRRQLDGLDDAR